MKIFFDLDGPILDITERYYSIYAELLRQEGYSPISKGEYWECKRNRVSEAAILEKTCQEAFLDTYNSKRLNAIEDFHYLKMDRLQEGVLDVLKEWSRRHYLFILTMRKRRENLVKQLEYLKIKDYFSHLYAQPDNDGTWKVKHDLIKGLINKPEECIIIGDTESDIRAGKELGITTVAVTCGIRTVDLLSYAEPDFIFEDVRQMQADEIFQERISEGV